MDAYYFRQINLPFGRKGTVMRALLRYIAKQPGAVPRDKSFFQRFIDDDADRRIRTDSDPWLIENVARLFWVCCELGLLRYQYPYPHKGQTYLLTRAGRLLAASPQAGVTAFVGLGYLMAVLAGPVRHFNRIRNAVTVITGAFLWWRQQELSAVVVAISLAAGVISTWIASFFHRAD